MFQLEPYTAPDFSAETFRDAPCAVTAPAPGDGIAPDNYHAMSIFPEYFKIAGEWRLAEESRMDCVPVVKDGRVAVVEFRNLKRGDAVVCGRTERGEEGIFVHADGFGAEKTAAETFAFRQGHSRESSFSRDYDELYGLLEHERDHGNILWVAGPAVSFDHDARNAFSALIANGYVNGLLAGNALATHDLEGAYLGTALGQDIYTQKHHFNGHYNHLDTINRVRGYGSVARFIEEEKIDNGILQLREIRRALCAGRVHPGRRPAAAGVRQRVRGAGRHAELCAQGHHGHQHGHHAAHHRRGQHDALLPGAAGRHGAQGVFLLRGRVGIHGEQADGPGQPFFPGHRHQRAGLYRQHRQGTGRFLRQTGVK